MIFFFLQEKKKPFYFLFWKIHGFSKHAKRERKERVKYETLQFKFEYTHYPFTIAVFDRWIGCSRFVRIGKSHKSTLTFVIQITINLNNKS